MKLSSKWYWQLKRYELDRAPALVVADDVQLLREERGDGRMRERKVSPAARRLKDVSSEPGVSVLALAQVTRADKRPQRADL